MVKRSHIKRSNQQAKHRTQQHIETINKKEQRINLTINNSKQNMKSAGKIYLGLTHGSRE